MLLDRDWKEELCIQEARVFALVLKSDREQD